MKKEKLDDFAEEIDGSDQRDFLKLAGKGVLALALVSAIGASMDGNAAKTEDDKKISARTFGNMRLNVAKEESRKQFSLSGTELGKVLQNEGFIPGNVGNLGNAALHVSVSW